MAKRARTTRAAARDEMLFPDYKGGSIVNLMSSIQHALGERNPYPPLRLLPPASIKGKVLLIVIDGLGYEHLQRYGRHTLLWKHCRGPITSVFPSTTAAAVTTFDTGLAPQQHGITGWFVHLKEVGGIAAVLPFQPYIGGRFNDSGARRASIFSTPQIYTMRSSIVTHHAIAGRNERGGKKIYHPYKSLAGFFRKTELAIRHGRTQYIYSYWPQLDTLSHRHGYTSDEVRMHLEEIDRKLKGFLKRIEDLGVTVIITADHGHMVTRHARAIGLRRHEQLWDTLVLPPTGEPRAAYCYVRPAKVAHFERYVKTKLKGCCTLVKSEDAIRQGWFGLGRPHRKLDERIGDYILIMKKDYIVADIVDGKLDYYIGNHGGCSREEMLVPLIVIRP